MLPDAGTETAALDLGVVADLNVRPDDGPRAEMGEGADPNPIRDLR
jgi:hypothetical protein